MAKKKLIHILPHSPNPIIYEIKPETYFDRERHGEYIKIDKFPHWVGFFTEDFHVLAAEKIKETTDEFDLECWRVYEHIDRVYEREINGITHKLFPVSKFKIKKLYDFAWSNQMIKYINEYSKNSEIIVNLTVGHSFLTMHFLSQLKSRNFPIVCIHRSGGFRKIYWEMLNPIKKAIRSYYLLETYFDIKTLGYADFYFVCAKPEVDFIKERKLKINSSSFFMEGEDFTAILPVSLTEKLKLREELNLPPEKKIFICYGDFSSKNYNYRVLYEISKEILEEHHDIHIINIGGFKGQDLYEYGISCGVNMIERVDKEQFIKYLQASDFFGQPMISKAVIFGGLGTALIEALACDIPVISDHLMHFPGCAEELKLIGLRMNDRITLKNAILFMKDNLQEFKNCRIIAKKYFDINDTKMVMLKKYHELSNKYFG